MSTLVMIIVGILVAILILLISREIVCWYNKINQRIILQERTNYLLEQIFEQLGGEFESDGGDETKDYSKAILRKEKLDNKQ